MLGQSVVLLGSDMEDFLGGTVDKNLSANAGDTGSIPGLERFHMLLGNWATSPCTTTIESVL